MFSPLKIPVFRPKMQELSLYFHIPFCERKCPYCDFYSVVDGKESQHRFVQALLREMEMRAERFSSSEFRVTTVFFGGGTPSVLPVPEMERLISAVRRYFSVSPEAEWTVEANPGTVDQAKFESYRALGFNRLSLGIQSFHDSELRRLGRIHTASEARAAVKLAQNVGFENINLDLIFGLPQQSVEDWEDSLKQALSLRPTHISTYNLIYEPETPFDKWRQTGKIRPLDETVEWEMYRRTDAVLTRAGYRHYEISNFSLPGKECRHNLTYWQGKSYWGFGPSAHSFHHNRRWWNVRSVSLYNEKTERGEEPTAGKEALTREQQRLEMIFLSLRQAEGLDLEAYRRKFGDDFRKSIGEVLQRFGALQKTTEPLFQETRHRLRLTLRGFWLSDAIFELFA